jgi:signal transduction histidine kinase
MRRRILLAILSITALAIALFALPLVFVTERFVDENATLRLERQAILAARSVPDDYRTSNDAVELVSSGSTHLALYDPDGARVSGVGPSTADATTAAALRNRVGDTESERARIVAVPVTVNEQVIGAIRAEQATSATNQRAWRVAGLVAALAAAVLGIGAAVAFVVAGRLARPIRRLSDAAVQLGEGDFEVDLPRSPVPEIDDANRALTTTAHHLDELVSRERSFSADASHQLRTPLAGLRAAIETEIEFPRNDRALVLREVLGDIDRLEETITELLALARRSHSSGVTSPAEVLREVEREWHGRLAALGRPLIIDAESLPLVQGPPAALRHAISILVDNATRHGRGAVRVSAEAALEAVTISVSDDGPGFPEAFEPGRLTPDEAGDGQHGVGLPLARRLVTSMPGRLVFVRLRPRPRIDIVVTAVDVPALAERPTSPAAPVVSPTSR